MPAYLIAEEGSLADLVIPLEEGNEWVLGRDPDAATFVLADPMVSRKHVIFRLTSEGYYLENLSAVNPATQNGKIIVDPVLLQEGDILQIGSTFFRFSEKMEHPETPSQEAEIQAPAFAEYDDFSSLNPLPSSSTRWLAKVISGPNAGAEFSLTPGSSYVIGKDPVSCTIVFQDLSVSREHAKLTIDSDERVFIEDLNSRNGTFVNSTPITQKQELASQDTIVLGTTSFLVIDRTQSSVTIVSLPPVVEKKEEIVEPAKLEETPQEAPNIRDMVISKKHLWIGGVLSFVFLLSFIGMVSLFQTTPIATSPSQEIDQIRTILHHYSAIQYSYNEGSGKLFLTGHVLTSIEKQELLYQIRGLVFVQQIEDSVVIDELVWQNMNSLLMTNPGWQGIGIYSISPGKFAVRGYLQTVQEAQTLTDYLNINFPYLDRLENQVVVESLLNTQLESLLLEKGFNNVEYQLSNGEVILSGRIDKRDESKFETLLREFKTIRGVRLLKNYVIYTSEDSSLIDISDKYQVLGFSKKDGENQYIVINGKILTLGDVLDGMVIVSVQSQMVLLEKDGLKFKINYNLQ